MKLSDEQRAKIARLSEADRLALIGVMRRKQWAKIARDEQKSPPVQDNWFMLYFQGGRGSGKSRSMSEVMIDNLATRPGTRGFLLGPTMRHVTQVMLNGESGILTLIGDESLYNFRELKGEVNFANGSQLILYTAERQDLFRGNEFHYGWMDEPAEFENGIEGYETLVDAMRLNDGNPVHLYVSGTPKQVPLTKYLKGKCADRPDRYINRQGSTEDNLSNLDENMRERMEAARGTRRYMQEYLGVLLEDAEDALWETELLANIQVGADDLPKMDRLIIAIDPALTTDKKADETGIILGGVHKDRKKRLTTAYVLGDFSCHEKPLTWARRVAELAVKLRVREIVYERNIAGPMIEDILRKTLKEHAPGVKLHAVTVNKSKMHRAEPVSSLYYAGRVRHCHGFIDGMDLHALEEQMVTWSPSGTSGKSPDRIDALVHFVDRALVRTGGLSAMAPDRISW